MPIRPPTHRAAGQARRTALLEAAVEVIAEGGVVAATHRAIASRAGVPLSTTSYFFASIDELLAEAMELMVTRLIDSIEAISAEIAEQQLNLDELVERYVDYFLAVPTTFLAAEFTIYVQCPYRPELQVLAHRMMAAFEEAAKAVLAQAGAADPATGARAIIALIDGFALQRFAWPRGDADRDPLVSGLRALFRAYTA
ncbi:TetR/AcrR family transcriptional regulator [Nocardia sp. NBC_01388]|uniref:TetR/AcrR family transcriptional regulator n=1 Tax=Nocardia sp. NBC_01388 TaxID=2903596 RepID=UPI00325670FA